MFSHVSVILFGGGVYPMMHVCVQCTGHMVRCPLPDIRPGRVPTRTGKPGKMGRHFPVREKSGNFEQTGKVRENYTKYWKIEINII